MVGGCLLGTNPPRIWATVPAADVAAAAAEDDEGADASFPLLGGREELINGVPAITTGILTSSACCHRSHPLRCGASTCCWSTNALKSANLEFSHKENTRWKNNVKIIRDGLMFAVSGFCEIKKNLSKLSIAAYIDRCIPQSRPGGIDNRWWNFNWFIYW